MHAQATLGSLPWRSSSQHDLAAKSCLAYNFVIRSRILQLFHRNDHHIEMMCHYLDHCLALCRNDHHIRMTSRALHFGRYLEGQSHSITLEQNQVRSITSLFEVPFYFLQNGLLYRVTVSRSRFGSLPWRPCSKSVSGLVVIWSRILQLFDNNNHHIEMMCHYLAHCLALYVLYRIY